MPLNDLIRRLLSFRSKVETTADPGDDTRVDHIVLFDGTLSSLKPGDESNIGLIYKLLLDLPDISALSIHYEKGIQWKTWSRTRDVIEGRGINRQIRRAYGLLAQRYAPGDRIYFFGYSRGAYAIRSLAGLIDRIGLIRADMLTDAAIETAYDHYREGPDTPAAKAFARAYCHDRTPIEMIGAFDTVKALGFTAPVLWRLSAGQHRFHSTGIVPSVRHVYHALAHDERRKIYTPIPWTTSPETEALVEQVWFRGTHGDIGGMINGMSAARPLSNIPLVWMLSRAEARGLALPEGWRARFPLNPDAPSSSARFGWGSLFVNRRTRRVGLDASERLHWSVTGEPPEAWETRHSSLEIA